MTCTNSKRCFSFNNNKKIQNFAIASGKQAFFTPQPLRAVRVLSGYGQGMGGRREKVCPGCISETVRCRKLIRGRDIS